MSDRRATLLWNLTQLPKILMEALTCLWREPNNAALGRGRFLHYRLLCECQEGLTDVAQKKG